LRELEYRFLLHARLARTAHRYIGALTCQFCDNIDVFIGSFETLISVIARVFWFIENLGINSDVAKVTITVTVYTEKGTRTIVSIPQLEGRFGRRRM